MSRYFTGVGSRETPDEVLGWMFDLAYHLTLAGLIGRSGGAPGADTEFEKGARKANPDPEAFHAYLPWALFNDNPSKRIGVTAAALRLAATLHPAWERLGSGPRKLHARNCNQVLGEALDTPSELTICWTPDGCESERTRTRQTGGTATAIVLSERNRVPVFNLRNAASRKRLNAWLSAQGIAYQLPTEEPGPAQAVLF